MAIKNERKIRVAIVGTGMAGLATAYLLSHDKQNRYVVTLFEKGERLALDFASVSVQDIAGDGHVSRVDLPMRAFADGYYAHLKAMYDHIGVQYRAQRFLFAFAKTGGSEVQKNADPYFTHASNNHVFPPMRPRETSLLRHFVAVFFLAVCYLWLTACFFAIKPLEAEDFGQYLKRIRIPWSFVTHYVLPLMCSVATCTPDALLSAPAQDLVTYKTKTHRGDHFVVSGGVHTVQERLVEGLDLNFNAQVVRVQPGESEVTVSWTTKPGDDGLDQGETFTQAFDRVVLAVAPDIVAQIFDPLQELMSRIPTQTVESTLLQPSEMISRLSVVHYTEQKGKGYEAVRQQRKPAETITLHTRFSSQSNPEMTEAIHLLSNGARVTTCAFNKIDDGEVLHRSRFTRVLRSVESRKIVNGIFQGRRGRPGVAVAQDEKSSLLQDSSSWRNGDGKVWLAGGWCWDGMVLLEGCVVSAMRIAEDFDVVVPWLAGS